MKRKILIKIKCREQEFNQISETLYWLFDNMIYDISYEINHQDIESLIEIVEIDTTKIINESIDKGEIPFTHFKELYKISKR